MVNKDFFVLSEKALTSVETAMTEALKDAKIHSCLFVDRSGYVVAHKGNISHLTNEEIGVITAGVVACINALTSLGQTQQLTILFHVAQTENLHIQCVTPRTFLVLFIERGLTETAARKAGELFISRVKEDLEQDETKGLDFGSLEFIEGKLNELFREL